MAKPVLKTRSVYIKGDVLSLSYHASLEKKHQPQPPRIHTEDILLNVPYLLGPSLQQAVNQFRCPMAAGHHHCSLSLSSLETLPTKGRVSCFLENLYSRETMTSHDHRWRQEQVSSLVRAWHFCLWDVRVKDALCWARSNSSGREEL